MDYKEVPTDAQNVERNKAAEAGETLQPSPVIEPPIGKLRIYRTICVFIGYFVSGMFSGVIGPTLLQMELYLETDTSSIALALTSLSLGYLIGAFICGFLFDRVNQELYLAISYGTYSTIFALAPFFGGLPAYIGMLGVFGFFQGLAFTAGQPYCLHLWDGFKSKKSIMQALYLAWSIGATVGPFMIRSFLVKLPSSATSDTAVCGAAITNATMLNMVTSDPGIPSIMQLPNITTSPEIYNESIGHDAESVLNPELYASVRFAYVTAGCVGMIASVFFAVAFCKHEPTVLIKKEKLVNEKAAAETKTSGLVEKTKAVVLMHIFLFSFYFLYQLVEYCSFSLVAAFSVKQLCWQNKSAATLTSVLYASHGLGRLLGVPTAAFVSPKKMLIGDFVLNLAAFLLMVFVNEHFIIMWLSVGLAGFSMSTIFASCLLHVDAVIRVTGLTSAAFMIASSVAGMTGPVIVGNMIDKYSPMRFVYVMLGGAILQVLTFIAMDLYIRTLNKRKTNLL